MTDPTDPMDGPPTRPDLPEPARRRRNSSQQLRAVVCVRCKELQRRLTAVQAARDSDAATLRAAESRAVAATIRAESAERKLRALRGARE